MVLKSTRAHYGYFVGLFHDIYNMNVCTSTAVHTVHTGTYMCTYIHYIYSKVVLPFSFGRIIPVLQVIQFTLRVANKTEIPFSFFFGTDFPFSFGHNKYCSVLTPPTDLNPLVSMQ